MDPSFKYPYARIFSISGISEGLQTTPPSSSSHSFCSGVTLPFWRFSSANMTVPFLARTRSGNPLSIRRSPSRPLGINLDITVCHLCQPPRPASARTVACSSASVHASRGSTVFTFLAILLSVTPS